MKIRFSTVAVLGMLLAACGGGAAPVSAPASSPAAASASGGSAASTAGAGGDSLEAVKAQAQKDGKVLWYDSIEQDQGDQIINAFKADYPFMSGAKFLSIVSGSRPARITQESTAKGPTADVDFQAARGVQDFYDKGFVETVDWQAMGIRSAPGFTPNNYMIAVTAPYYVIIYNTQKVKGDEAPKAIEDLLDPKWKGRIGGWGRPAALIDMSAVWGEPKTFDVAKKFAAQGIKLYDSNFTIAQDVGSGNIDAAVTTYHTTLPTQEKGAPIKVVTLDPVPMDPLYGYLLKYGQYHAGGKLLLDWLVSGHGAQVYEQVSGRGDPFVPETKTAQAFAGKQTANYSVDDQIKNAQHLNDLEAQLTKTLKGQG